MVLTVRVEKDAYSLRYLQCALLLKRLPPPGPPAVHLYTRQTCDAQQPARPVPPPEPTCQEKRPVIYRNAHGSPGSGD